MPFLSAPFTFNHASVERGGLGKLPRDDECTNENILSQRGLRCFSRQKSEGAFAFHFISHILREDE